ncbi:MAG: NUDIX hydrolase [Candidatus Kariarchaeaceae archaeon]
MTLAGFEHFTSEIAAKFPSLDYFKSHIKEQLKQREERLVDRSSDHSKEAAILFLLIVPKISSEEFKIAGNIFDHVYLLLEKRSNNLKQNPGDMAFPGGRVDSADNNLIETAYREAEEEVGINPDELQFLACMDEFVSSSQIIVRTIISWLELDIPIENFRETVEKMYAPKTNETDNTVVVPLSHCLDPYNYSSTEFQFSTENDGRRGYVRYYNIDRFLPGTHIWGLTASMIRRFNDIIFPNNLLPEEPNY